MPKRRRAARTRVVALTGVAGFFALVGLRALTACSFILDVEGPRPPPPEPVDGSPDGSAVGDTDGAIVEPPPEDAGVPDAPMLPFCEGAGPVRLCDDFERPDGDVAGAGWTPVIDPGGTLDVVTEDGSTFLRVAIAESGATGRATLTHAFPAPPQTRLLVRARLRLTTLPTSPVAMVTVVLGTPPDARTIAIVAGPSAVTLVETDVTLGTRLEHPLAIAFATSRWVAVDLRLGFDATPPNVDLALDGQTALSFSAAAGTVPDVPTFAIGAEATPAPSFTFDVDDVVLDGE